MQWVLKQWFHCRTNTEVLEQPGMPPQGTDWITIKKLFGLQKVFFFTGLNAPLIFYFFHSDGNKKNFLEPEKFFFTRCTCFESNFCPPRFLNLINSPRLNCKDSPRTSSALALNCADIYIQWLIMVNGNEQKWCLVIDPQMTILPLGLMGLSKSGYPITMVKMAIAMIGTINNNGNWDNDNQN